MTDAPAVRHGVVTRERVAGQPSRIVVVGAGDCGTRAALTLRQLGFAGEVTLVGDEDDVPYERPPLSKAALTAEADEAAPPLLVAEERLAELSIRWEHGSPATHIDRAARTVALANGRTLSFDRLLLATGSRARRPSIPGGEHTVLTLRSNADSREVRARLQPGARVVILGGGFIGLEVAVSAAARGCHVTVLEFAHRLMTRVVPTAIADLVRDRHRAAGVDLRCGVAVHRIDARGSARSVVLSDASTVAADVVVAGVGAVPNTELAAGAGLMVSNGIRVDEHLRTDDPDIFAAGDCCSFPHPLYDGARVRIEAWRNALDHADVAARNLLGGDVVADSVPWFWSDQYDLGLQVAGLHAFAFTDVGRSRDDGAELHFGLDARGRVVSVSGIGTGTTVGRDVRQAAGLIARRATPRATALSNPAVSLRELLENPS